MLVTVAVLVALRDAFGPLGRAWQLLRVLGAACGAGLLTVVTRMLGDEGVGVVETYVVRTALAAAVFIALFPPRDIPLRAGAAALRAVAGRDDVLRPRSSWPPSREARWWSRPASPPRR